MKEEYIKLYNLAKEASISSYSCYSGFSVGAALLCADGSIYTGCNIENKSFSLTVCAERVAFFKAISDNKKIFKAIAICGRKSKMSDELCMPCGACRQVMREFCKDNFVIIVKDKVFTLADLMPYYFDNDF